MEIDIKEIVDGKMNGKYVYICDYRPSNGAKPIRHVKAQKVLVRCNDEITHPNVRVYYSESHFIGLNKKGEPLKSKVIKPFDSTGYRSYTGVPVCVFDNMEECEAQYKEFDDAMNPKPVCCPHCRKTSPKDIQLNCNNTRVMVVGESIVTSDDNGNVEFSTINFCPMCGRKLR